MRNYNIGLSAALTGAWISTAGGYCIVTAADSTAKATLYNADGSSLSNPVALTYGKVNFWTADSVNSVDLFIMTPGGQFVVYRGVTPSGLSQLTVDTQTRHQVAVIPFNIADTTAATETSTGIALPTDALVLPMGMAVRTTTIDATETIDVGILSSESGGDADGLIAALSVGTAGTFPANNVVTVGGTETYFSSTTLGALVNDFLAGSNTGGDVGTANPKAYRIDGTAKTISYTLTTGTDTATGYIMVPYVLGAFAV